MGTVTLKFADVKFLAYPKTDIDDDEDTYEPPSLSLTIIVKDGTISVSNHISDMVNIMIMAAIGEYESVKYISAINYIDTLDEGEQNVFPLSKLPLVLDNYLYHQQQKNQRNQRSRE